MREPGEPPLPTVAMVIIEISADRCTSANDALLCDIAHGVVHGSCGVCGGWGGVAATGQSGRSDIMRFLFR